MKMEKSQQTTQKYNRSLRDYKKLHANKRITWKKWTNSWKSITFQKNHKA